ncbi:hypothetical protein [Paenibacillus donghaensis]|uniref:Uncharacterized protein n=1 Tax=Paenibacillus donghaensis TaxID=414771 RepID=A0A2Z2KBX1_9BACL|nr:hypothetical protein [Paenibacillus donghaensis]ASA20433.1 hypothetical protein B9T62_06210 [Paenibacillus donghaensis]
MIRIMARAQLRDEGEAGTAYLRTGGEAVRLIGAGQLMTAAAYKWNRNVFLYYECKEAALTPEALLPCVSEMLEDWPGIAEPRKWVPLIDVFHFNAPQDAEHWRRKQPVERQVGRVAHLKPEMVASYIYYHYQLQEEQAFYGPKYEIIGLHENLLFGYQEFPAVVEEPVVTGKLATSGTPEDWSQSRMDLHFQPWPDGHLYFKPVETLFSLQEKDGQRSSLEEEKE